MSLLHENHPFKGAWTEFIRHVWDTSGDGNIFYLRPDTSRIYIRTTFEATLRFTYVSTRYHNYANKP